jgi:hypothetical protein
MKRQIKKIISVLLTVCFVLSITAATVSAKAGNPNPGVLPVNSSSHGKTYGEWSEEWWKWALAIPADQNPILAPSGYYDASIGQSGNVWFLAGTGGVTGIVRNCTIPTGKAIFIPIINVVSFPYPDPETDEQLKSDVKYVFDQETVHEIELDGKNLDNFRVPSDIFVFWIPENSYLNLGYPDMPSGFYRAASDGYWVMLKPLPVGKHTIRIYGKGILTETGVTYNIIVK